MKNYIIRNELPQDYFVVENLIREAFWNVYRPGCLEHYVINQLRDNPDFVKELDFVMESEGEIIGQNMFVRSNIQTDDGKLIPVLTMGPICITPELRRCGYGKILLEYSLDKAKELGYGAICIEGNINFYGKCGFDYGRTYNLRYQGLSETDDSSFFLCIELIPDYLKGISGVYAPHQGYLVDENEAEEFDKKFPPKQKLKLSTQLFS